MFTILFITKKYTIPILCAREYFYKLFRKRIFTNLSTYEVIPIQISFKKNVTYKPCGKKRKQKGQRYFYKCIYKRTSILIKFY